MNAGQVTVGVDLGGTGTRFVALTDDDAVLVQRALPTPRGLGADDAVDFLHRGLQQVVGPHQVRAIGIGASGPIDTSGVIRNPDTLPAFSGIDLAGPVSEAFSVTTVIDNDAVTAAVYEATLGVARHHRSVLMVTLGTGIGVACIADGRPVRGTDGAHPEAGHLSLTGAVGSYPSCYCGRTVCWEQVASRSALQRAVSTVVADPVGDLGDIRRAAGLAENGDPAALRVFDEYGRGLASGLSDVLTVYRPACVVLGGTGAHSFGSYSRAFHERLSSVRTYADPPEVLLSEAGEFGGAIGAAVLARATPRWASWPNRPAGSAVAGDR